MPRIEIIPMPGRAGDATPSVDVCCGCKRRFREGSTVPTEAVNCVREAGFNDADEFRIGSTDVGHPPYGDVYIECCVCGEILTVLDD